MQKNAQNFNMYIYLIEGMPFKDRQTLSLHPKVYINVVFRLTKHYIVKATNLSMSPIW